MKKTLVSFAVAMVLLPSISFAATPISVEVFEAQRIQLMEQIIVLLKARIEYLTAILGQKPAVLGISTTTSVLTTSTTTPVVVKKKRSGGGGGGSSSASSREIDRACVLSLILKDAPLETKAMYLNSFGEPTYVWWGLNTTEEVHTYIVGWLRNYETTGAIYYRHNPDYTYEFAMSHIPVLEARLTEYYKNKQLCGVESSPYTFTPYVAATPTPAYGELAIGTSADNPDSSTLVVQDDARSDLMTVLAFTMDTGSSTRSVEVNKIPVTIEVTGDDFGNLVSDLALVIDGEVYDNWEYATGTETSTSMVAEFNIGGHTINSGQQANVELQVVFQPLITEGATIQATLSPENVLSIDAETYGTSTPVVLSGSVTGETHILRTRGVDVSVEDSSVAGTSVDGDLNDYAVYEIQLEVTAFEQDVYIPTNPEASFSYTLQDGAGTPSVSGTRSVALASTADEENGFFVINEAETEIFTFTVSFSPGVMTASRLQLNSISFGSSVATPMDQVWLATPLSDYRTQVWVIVN